MDFKALKITLVTILFMTSCFETERDECISRPELLNSLSESQTSISFRNDTLVINLSGDSASVFELTNGEIMSFSFGLSQNIFPIVLSKPPNNASLGFEAIITDPVRKLSGTVFAIDECEIIKRDNFDLTISLKKNGNEKL